MQIHIGTKQICCRIVHEFLKSMRSSQIRAKYNNNKKPVSKHQLSTKKCLPLF